MSMSMGAKGVKSDINITRYIDILLVLLIIFMTVSPMKPKDHPIKVPKQAQKVQPKEVQKDSLVIDMDIDHKVKLNTQEMTLDKLQSMLTDIFNRRALNNRGIFIRGDSDLPYGDVFVLLDIAKKSGATDIALIEYRMDHAAAGSAKGSN
jgi:biopolymer transport protein TolR